MMIKACNKCGTDFEVPKSMKKNTCTPCQSARVAAWAKKNPDKVKATQKRYYDNNPDKMREKWKNYKNSPTRYKRTLWYQYGMTAEEYIAKLEAQEGKCQICGEYKGDKLVVDHCHDTGLIRGLLCRFCNLALGQFKDKKENLLNAAMYLEYFETSPEIP